MRVMGVDISTLYWIIVESFQLFPIDYDGSCFLWYVCVDFCLFFSKQMTFITLRSFSFVLKLFRAAIIHTEQNAGA